MLTINEIVAASENEYSELQSKFRYATGQELTCSILSDRVNVGITTTASVIIATWNDAETIFQCLKSIEICSFNINYPHLLEVIVVDDGSTDGTWEMLTILRLKLHIIAIQQSHRGQSTALNTALKMASGEIIISCDADMLLLPYTLEDLVLRHQILGDAVFVGFRHNILRSDLKDFAPNFSEYLYQTPNKFYTDCRIKYYWPGWPENMVAETNQLKCLGGMKRLFLNNGHSPFGTLWTLPQMVVGALFSMMRKDFIAIGGYDTRLSGWGYNDTLIGAKAIALGLKIIPISGVTGLHVNHADRSSTKQLEAKNNLDIYTKIINSESFDAQNNIDLSKNSMSLSREFTPVRKPELDFNPDNMQSDLNMDELELGKIHFFQGQYEIAAQLFERVIPLVGYKSRESARFFLGKALAYLGKFDESFCVLDTVCKESKNIHTKIELSLVLCALEKYEDAHKIMANLPVSHIETNLNYDPFFDYIMGYSIEDHLTKCKLHMNQQDYLWSLKDLDVVLLRDRSNLTARRLQQECLVRLSDTEKNGRRWIF